MRSLGWAVVLLLALPLAAADNDWSQFRFNETHQGSVPAALNNVFAPFKENWWPNVSAAPTPGSPVVHGGLVYFGDSTGAVHAFNRTTGEKVWSNTTTSSRISSTPAVGARSLYVITEAGLVYAFDRTSGRLESGFPLTVTATRGSLLLHGDILYVGGSDGVVHSYFASTQEFRWSFDSKGTFFGKACLGGRIDGTPVVFETWLLFGSTNHCFYAVATSQPIGKVTNPVWVHVATEAIRSSPTVDATNRRVIFGDVSGKVYALPVSAAGNATTPAWTYQEPISQGVSSEIHASPAISGDKVIVAALNGNVRALSLSAGALQWTRNVGGNVTSSPAVANGYALVGGYDANLYMLQVSDGTVAGKWPATASIETSPAISGTQGFWTAKDGTAYSWGGARPKQPDLLISSGLAAAPVVATEALVIGIVRNAGAASSTDATATLYEGESKIADVAIPALTAGQEHTVETPWTPIANGSFTLRWVLDAANTVAESDEKNNEFAFDAQVADPPKNATADEPASKEKKLLGFLPGAEVGVILSTIAAAAWSRRRNG